MGEGIHSRRRGGVGLGQGGGSGFGSLRVAPSSPQGVLQKCVMVTTALFHLPEFTCSDSIYIRKKSYIILSGCIYKNLYNYPIHTYPTWGGAIGKQNHRSLF